jgi:uncharacterized membrane protein YkvI
LLTILLLVLGGLVGCRLPNQRRLLLGTLLLDLVVIAVLLNHGVHWLTSALSLLLPLLVAALVGATLTQWYRRSKAAWGRRSSRTNSGSV